MINALIIAALLPTAAVVVLGIFWHSRWREWQQQQDMSREQRQEIQQLLKTQEKEQYEQRQRFDQHQIQSLTLIQDSLQKAMQEVRSQIAANLHQYAEHLGKRVDDLT